MHAVIYSINETIASIFDAEANVQLYGIAESVAARDEEGEKTVPAIVLPSGECLGVYSLADMKDATFYHRLHNTNFTLTTSFGSRKAYERVSDVSLVVFGKRAKHDQYALADAVCEALGSRTDITLQSVDYNLLQIFSSEYSGLTCFLNPDYFLFRINYRITSTQDGCIKPENI